MNKIFINIGYDTLISTNENINMSAANCFVWKEETLLFFRKRTESFNKLHIQRDFGSCDILRIVCPYFSNQSEYFSKTSGGTN